MEVDPASTQAITTPIHPLLGRDKFEEDVNYDDIIQGPALLASRLLDSPQALHYFYTHFFGRNTKVPTASRGSNVPDPGQDVPELYRSDKGVNDLSSHDKTAVREQLLLLSERVEYKLVKCATHVCAQCVCHPMPQGIRGCRSVIELSGAIYFEVENKSRMDEDNAYIALYFAMTMLHEIAHAACYAIMGDKSEDYFEDSLIAEAGFELESRLFGMVPHIQLSDPSESTWDSWQALSLDGRYYSVGEVCRNIVKLPNYYTSHWLDWDFALKLVNNGFWAGEYAERGGVALIPPSIIEICRNGGNSKAHKAIPTSIKELWMQAEGIGYAQRSYPHLANRYYEIRTKALAT